MAKRKLKELNLLDDFLFGTLVSHEEFGEAFCRELLQTIFHRKFGRLKVIPQRQYYGNDTTKHGTRLDVYLEEDNAELEPEALYDLEPENAKDKNRRKFLPKRTRFYRAIVDGHSLASGTDYGTLKNAVNPSLQRIQRMVEDVKEDKGVLLEYMKIWEREQQIREEAIEEGREAGRKAGMIAGKQAATKTLTLNMLSKKKFSYEEIADLVGITTEEVRKIEKEQNVPTV